MELHLHSPYFMARCLATNTTVRFTYVMKTGTILLNSMNTEHQVKHCYMVQDYRITEMLRVFAGNTNMRVYPKVSGLAAWSENCKWYSSLPLGTDVSLFCESV
jgi:hypothetical protein